MRAITPLRWRPGALILLLSPLLICTPLADGTSGEDGIEERALVERLNGQVLFMSSVFEGLAEPAICALRLPGRQLEVLVHEHPKVTPSHIYHTPVWGRDTSEIYFHGHGISGRGLFRLSRGTDSLSQIMKTGTHYHQSLHPDSTRELIMEMTEYGYTMGFYPPGVEIVVARFAFGKQSHSLYAVIKFDVNGGPPSWTFDPDSTEMPSWARERVEQRWKNRTYSWSDLVMIDAAGEVTFIRGLDEAQGMYSCLAVSSDERFVAVANRLSGAIFNLSSDTSVQIPMPVGTTVAHLAFTPRSNKLTVIARTPHQQSSVLTLLPPLFTGPAEIVASGPPDLDALCWSMDESLILLHGALTHYPGAGELAVRDVKTSKFQTIAFPYFLRGKRAKEFYAEEGIDWMEDVSE